MSKDVRRLTHLRTQPHETATCRAIPGTRSRVKFNRPPVETSLGVHTRLRLALTEWAPVPVVITGLILRWGAHGASLAGGGFEGGEFKVGGEVIGELVGGAVDGGGHVEAM